jgi:PTS system nitrogen regulatory IIA component
MHVVDILSPHRVAVATDRLRTKPEALQRLAELLAGNGEGRLTVDTVHTMLSRREDTQSTGVGGGVAIPHAAMEDLEQIVGAVLLCPKPIPWEAIDGMPVSILFAVIGPRKAVGEHLKTLARVSRLLRDDAFRTRLVSAVDGAQAFQLIVAEEARPQ